MRTFSALIFGLSGATVLAWLFGMDLIYVAWFGVGVIYCNLCREIYAWLNTSSTYIYPSPANWRTWDEKVFWECYYLHSSEFGMKNALYQYASEKRTRAAINPNKQASDFWKAIAEEFV